MRVLTFTVNRPRSFARKWLIKGARWGAQSFKTLAGWLSAYPTTDANSKVFENGRPRTGGSIDMALAGNLSNLAAQGRHVERGTCMGRAVAEAWKADLVGSGIDVSPKTGDKELDKLITAVWKVFVERACVDGAPLWEWQALCVGNVPPSGAALTRIVILKERIAQGLIPLALLPLEIEWLSELPVAPIGKDFKFCRGIELDIWGRPQFYHLRNPENLNVYDGERVAASEIIHMFEKRRAQQTHGEPVLAPAIERILQCDRLVRTELDAANNTAATSVLITTQHDLGNEEDADGETITDLPSGTVGRLRPGEGVETVENKRPAQGIEPFVSAMRGDVSAATRVNRQCLDRDYQRSTFMNSRMSNQDTDRLQASIKSMVNRCLAGRVYELAFPWMMMALGRPMPADPRERAKIMRYVVRPDARPYVDPVKDIAAAGNAVAMNFSTMHIECAARGRDFDDIIEERMRENEALTLAGLPLPATIKPSAQPVTADSQDTEGVQDA